jgi:hypothetical protein
MVADTSVVESVKYRPTDYVFEVSLASPPSKAPVVDGTATPPISEEKKP